MRQALRVNENVPKFYTEYLKFEVKFLDKLMQRREILNGQSQIGTDGNIRKKEKELEFIDDEEDKESDIEGEVKRGEEGNIVKIVVENLLEKFPNDIILLREVKNILKQSKHIDPDSTLRKVKEAYKQLKEENPLSLIELYFKEEITLPLLIKGLKRIEHAKEPDSRHELRRFFVKAAIKLLTTTTSNEAKTIFDTLIAFCDSDLEKLEYIFTYGKLSHSNSDLKVLYLDEMSNSTKSTLEWIVTNVKLTKTSLDKNELKELEMKSNNHSKNKLNILAKSGFDESTEFSEKVFVYAKYIIILQMVAENKHDIAI